MMEKLIAIIKEISNVVPESLDENLFASGILDSFRMARLIVAIEEEFKVEIEIDDIVPENFVSIQKMSKLIDTSKEKKHED